MSGQEPGETGQHLGNANADILLEYWEELAAIDAGQPSYYETPTPEEYLADRKPKIANRIAQDRPLRPLQKRALKRIQTDYPLEVDSIDQNNNSLYEQWLYEIADLYFEGAGLTVLGGDKPTADSLVEKAQEIADEPTNDNLAMSLIAAGELEDGKRALLGANRYPGQIHLHNLLDAYIVTGDPDYRESFVAVSHATPYLMVRMLKAVQKNGESGYEIFMSAADFGARIALAATIATSRNSEAHEIESLKQYLKSSLPKLQPPSRRTIGPKDRAAEAIKEDGIFGVFDVAMEGADFLLGGSYTEESPEYRNYVKEMGPVLATLAPLLDGLPGYKDTHFSNINDYKRATVIKILKDRSNWGDKSAGPQVLTQANSLRRESKEMLPIYRNILRDMGSVAAARFIRLLPTHDRREAAYHAAVKSIFEGQAFSHSPKIPDVVDEFGPLQELYERTASLETDIDTVRSPSIEKELSQARAETLVDLTMLSNIRPQDLRQLIAQIKSLNDPETEKRLLEILIQKLALP